MDVVVGRSLHQAGKEDKIVGRLPRVLILLSIIGCCLSVASADVIGAGELTFDSNTSAALATFDITDLTGVNAFPPTFPITSDLTITVTSLIANLQGGGTITLNGSDFSVVDAQGDVDCTVAGDAGSGGCDFSAYNLVSATVTGTLNPTTGLAGLPAGDTFIESAFTTTITPNVGCGPTGGTGTALTAGCDAATIYASTVPEPPSWTLLAIVLIGLFASYRFIGRGELA